MTLPRLYSAWFCPYAQRVWCALNELQMDYELVESLGSGLDPSYTKHPDLLRENPKGLVPTLSFPEDHRVYCESIDILKYLFSIQEENPSSSSKHMGDVPLSLLADEATRWNKLVCSPFYRVLIRQEIKEKKRAWVDMVQGLREFSHRLKWKALANQEISFYEYRGKDGSHDIPSLVDFTVFPFVHRLYIIEHYCQFSLTSVVDDDTAKNMNISPDDISKLLAWIHKMENLDSVKTTLADKTKLIAVYKRYADGSANSKVGHAVRQGREAHDI